MRVIYFDCFSGISGDMCLGALIDAGVDPDALRSELAKLGVGGYQLEVARVEKRGLGATDVAVRLAEEPGHPAGEHRHPAGEHRHHRHLRHIEEIIGGSDLSAGIKERSLKIFRRLAEAEALIHRTSVEAVHFHEVGAVDAIVDIVGTVIALELLGIERVRASRLPLGSGFVRCQHGLIPVPAPATLELLKGVPVYDPGIEAELVTPTGAAIVTTLADGFGAFPEIKVQRIGYGAGKRDLAGPNVLRVVIGEATGEENPGTPRLDGLDTDRVWVVEANIDDMNPEFFGYVMEKLYEAGVLEVFFTPVQMKKNRPATILTVLTEKSLLDQIVETILIETSSLGVRVREEVRFKAERQVVTVQLPVGPVRVKVGRLRGSVINLAPEFEDCRSLARESGRPIKEIYEMARAVASQEIR
ncbi:MAG: nickel pincer cofactor biosynthesis protein LarC [Actinobacteria bacterium]|nr:nickel pincer cofactor biosynthesis protein LarC [Actinomycetota bacterium]